MYQNILVAVDGSPTSNLALLEAARLAPSDAQVRVVHVIELPSWTVPLEYGVVYDVELLQTSLVKAGKDILERAKTLLKHKGIDARTQLVELAAIDAHNIPQAILQVAESWPADVIVVGTHGRRGFNRLLMGSVAETLLRSAARPVLLVRAPDTAEPIEVTPAATDSAA
ncbi:MAG: universal stress protein [Pseudomonadota bacterium]